MIGERGPSADRQRRERLGELDACLEALERANERGQSRLSDELFVRLGTIRVAGVEAGMRVEDALEAVFAMQEPLMESNRPAEPARARPRAGRDHPADGPHPALLVGRADRRRA